GAAPGGLRRQRGREGPVDGRVRGHEKEHGRPRNTRKVRPGVPGKTHRPEAEVREEVSEPVRLTMAGIHKHFGPTHALRGVDLGLRCGEVHALVGENGAGKSTLMKILSGAVRPDAGGMILDGKPYAPPGPKQARERGVAMIYQELTLAPHLSVEANV